MGKEKLCSAVDKLREQYLTLDWTYHDIGIDGQMEKMYRWPGPENDEI